MKVGSCIFCVHQKKVVKNYQKHLEIVEFLTVLWEIKANRYNVDIICRTHSNKFGRIWGIYQFCMDCGCIFVPRGICI